MSQVSRGRVKFFDKKKGFGFIIPEPGGKEVFFHVNYFSGPWEEYVGRLKLAFDTDLPEPYQPEYHPPKEGEILVYESFDGTRGLMAVHWGFPGDWEKAMKVISERPSPDNARVRMRRNGNPKNRYQPTTLWEGNDDEFRQKLDEGLPEVWREDVYFEQLKATGWERMWHPKDWHDKYKKKVG